MKTKILILLLSIAFVFTSGLNAQKLSKRKIQITGLKNAKILGTDVKGNVIDNSVAVPKYQAGSNIAIDNSDPLNPVISSTASASGDFVSYVGATKALNLGSNSLVFTNKDNDNYCALNLSGLEYNMPEINYGFKINPEYIQFYKYGNAQYLLPNPFIDDQNQNKEIGVYLPSKSGTLARIQDIEEHMNANGNPQNYLPLSGGQLDSDCDIIGGGEFNIFGLHELTIQSDHKLSLIAQNLVLSASDIDFLDSVSFEGNVTVGNIIMREYTSSYNQPKPTEKSLAIRNGELEFWNGTEWKTIKFE